MEIIEVSVGYPEWVGHFIWITALTVVAIAVGSVLVSVKSDSAAPGGIGFIVIAFIGLVSLYVVAMAHGHVTHEERVRVASEVSDVVGFDVSLEDVDRMFHEKPVEGIYYVRDGYSLVVEENE